MLEADRPPSPGLCEPGPRAESRDCRLRTRLGAPESRLSGPTSPPSPSHRFRTEKAPPDRLPSRRHSRRSSHPLASYPAPRRAAESADERLSALRTSLSDIAPVRIPRRVLPLQCDRAIPFPVIQISHRLSSGLSPVYGMTRKNRIRKPLEMSMGSARRLVVVLGNALPDRGALCSRSNSTCGRT
jgi:hypothetical protein